MAARSRPAGARLRSISMRTHPPARETLPPPSPPAATLRSAARRAASAAEVLGDISTTVAVACITPVPWAAARPAPTVPVETIAQAIWQATALIVRIWCTGARSDVESVNPSIDACPGHFRAFQLNNARACIT